MWQEVVSVLGGNLFKGVAEVIKTFVKDPTEALKAESALLTLRLEAERELAKLEFADRDSARKREMSVQGYTMPALTTLYTGGYFGILISLLFGQVTIAPDMKGLLDVLMGVLTAGQYSILSYYYGSSQGSSDKNRLLNGAK